VTFIGSLDQGTTSTRFIVFNELGEIVAQSQLEHQQILPQSGWVEHDADEIWRNTQKVIAEALLKAKISAKELAAIGITNQRETAVAWDRTTGKPISNAIVWQDTRTDQYLNGFSDATKATITEKTGTPIAPYFSASKFNWILRNKVKDRSNLAFGTVDAWILFNLTGQFVTDVTNASRTQLMNLETLDWDDELLNIFEIKREWLPVIKSSSEIYGRTSEGVPVAGILGDQQAAMVGQTCFNKGESKTTYGTGNFALLSTGTELVRSKNGLITTVLYKFGNSEVRLQLQDLQFNGFAISWVLLKNHQILKVWRHQFQIMVASTLYLHFLGFSHHIGEAMRVV
jgi:glycerol kinase